MPERVALGALLVLVAVFVWLWLGPDVASRLALIGMPLLIIGGALQVRDAGKGRPGYPGKLAITLLVFGLLMLPDLRYRESVGGPLSWQPMPVLMLIAGVWLCALWPIARRQGQKFATINQGSDQGLDQGTTA